MGKPPSVSLVIYYKPDPFGSCVLTCHGKRNPPTTPLWIFIYYTRKYEFSVNKCNFLEKNNYFFIETAYQINFYTVSAISNAKDACLGNYNLAENPLLKTFTARFLIQKKDFIFYCFFVDNLYNEW